MTYNQFGQSIQTPTGSSGFITPENEVSLPVHPTAARRANLIKAHSENTLYHEDFITSKFSDRGASVVTEADGTINVKPTVTTYELKTELKVPKTG